jgi:hypothetical protein
MNEPTEVKMPSPAGVFKTISAVENHLHLPFETIESDGIDLMDVAVAIAIVCSAAALFVIDGFQHSHNIFVFGLLVIIALPLLIEGLQSRLRKRRFGPTKLRLSVEGLQVSAVYSGILPWTEVAAVYLNFHHGKIHSATIKLKNPDFLDSLLHDARSKGIGYVKVRLNYFANQNFVGEAIIATSNAYSGSHSAWAGLPTVCVTSNNIQ